MFGPIFKGARVAASPLGRKALRRAVAVARSEEGKKAIAQARRVATGPEARKLAGDVAKLASRTARAAGSPESRARVRGAARLLRARGR